MASIVQAGEAVLRKMARPVPREKLGTVELQAVIDEMVATMRAAPGVGLAAPQIGLDWQLIVVEDDADHLESLEEEDRRERERTPLPLMAIVNPELEMVGSRQATFFEGCLSVSGWTALVTRALEVRVRGLTPRGESLDLTLSGWPARILQHEVDHLRGTLYVDRMHSRSFSRTELAQQAWKDRPVGDVARQLGIVLP